MASDRLKFVVLEINKLLGTNYSLISFDSLSTEHLLQVLTDVLSEVSQSNKIDIKQEELDETTVRILEMLRILKYKLEQGISPMVFRQGLVQGEKNIIHPILDWLVTNMDDLKKRCYLAQYLVKLDIPPEMLADSDISYLYEQYEALIEQFKSAHKESVALKETGSSVSELRTDIQAMEEEKEIVIKRIEKLNRRVENIREKNSLLELARSLRMERERERELVAQEEQQQTALMVFEQRMRRLQLQLRELRQSAQGATSSGLLRRLEEDCSVNSFIAQQKLPSEIATRQSEVQVLEEVLAEPGISRADLDDLNNKIQGVSAEINKLMEEHLARQNPSEDKNAPFRQQAAIIARKKDSKAEQLGQVRSQFAALEEELAGKQNELKDIAGDTILRGEEFRRYVAKLRGRSSLYKKNRSELAALKTEHGILTRTVDILVARDDTVQQALDQGFVVGLEKPLEPESDPDLGKWMNIEELSNIINQLGRRLASRRADLEPLIGELRPLREEYREVLDDFEQKKKVHDATAAGLENATAKVQEEVDKLKKDVSEVEQKIDELQKENEKSEEDLVKVAEEMKLYVSGNADAKKQSLREKLQQQIAEQEKLSKVLKEEQNLMKENQNKAALQVQYWKDLQTIMECKIRCMEDSKKAAGIIKREKGVDTLILTN